MCAGALFLLSRARFYCECSHQLPLSPRLLLRLLIFSHRLSLRLSLVVASAVIVRLCRGTLRGCCFSAFALNDQPLGRHSAPGCRAAMLPWLLRVLLLVVAHAPCRSLAARFCRVCVHFNKNICYFAYFIPKNVQNVRFFAFFAQNIWQFQKNVLPLQRI